MSGYDVIVLGVGGMGAASCYELARRDRRVLGLEQFTPGHARGSSHGQTRIIRRAYYEHPSYVPLVETAYERWHALEQLTGQHLLTAAPCLTVGSHDSELITGVIRSAAEHELAIEALTAGQVGEWYPAFHLPEGLSALLEPTAGFLYVEECVKAFRKAAEAHGAEIHNEEPVLEWKPLADGVEVRTAKATYHADRLVITAGAWATRWLADVGVPFTVMRQVMHWFKPRHPELFRRDRFPIFLVDTPGGAYYGLPMIDGKGFKLARHYGAPELASPDEVDWTVHDEDTAEVRAFVSNVFPDALGLPSHGQVCMYTLTPDRHFIIDRHPEYPQVAVAAGFSGHGFKFASVVGEILADLVENGQTAHDIELFRLNRFGANLTPAALAPAL